MKTAPDSLSKMSVLAMIKRINIIFFALMGCVFMFLMVSIYLVEVAKITGSSALDPVLLMVASLMAISCMVVAYVLSIGTLKKARAASENKIALYQTACLIRYSLLEGPSLYFIICYYLTGNRVFLAVLAAVLAILAINKPSLTRFRRDMGELI